jgi:glutamate dehydrogenase (NAD(P)+)
MLATSESLTGDNTMRKGQSPYKVALYQLRPAAEKLKLESGIHEMLKVPKRSLTVSIAIRTDNGGFGVFRGCRRPTYGL